MPISGSVTGKDVRVRIGNEDGPPETFTLIAFASTDTLRINNTEVEALTKDSGGWRDIFPNGSITSLTVDSTWVFDNTADQLKVRDKAAKRNGEDPKANFQIVDGSGDRFVGEFQIVSYEVTGEAEGFPQAAVSLASNGLITLEVDS